MAIVYSNTKEFHAEALEELFLSVEWSSGNYPEKLKKAMGNCDTVISAWDEGKLVGLMNALSDGVMTVYFHYVLVRPDYQGKGIGKELVTRMLDIYDAYARKVLISYDHQVEFYKRCGFKEGTGSTPMGITTLHT